MYLYNEYEFKECVDRHKGDRHATLAKANEKKNWRIYQDFATTLVKDATVL